MVASLRVGHSVVEARQSKRKFVALEPEMPVVEERYGTMSRYEDETNTPVQQTVGKKARSSLSKAGRGMMDDVEMEGPPMSPRIRKRLDEAKENANVFGPVCEQGEVIQWMTACDSGLIEFGHDLERRGFKTLSSIAFLTEEDIDPSIEPRLRQHLLATLARLRHEFFRM